MDMKKILLIMLCWPAALMAQNGIVITNFSANAGSKGAPSTLTFDMHWASLQGKVWNDTAWVFIDFNNAGAMTRLPLALGAGNTLTKTSAPGVGQIMEVPGNTSGVWVVGNARDKNASGGSFSATVQLLTATAMANFHGACIYAINYPPVGQYTATDKIKFTGTPDFYLKFKDGSSATVIRSAAKDAYTIPAGKALASFTDASGAPGLIKCKAPAVQTLKASASAYCADLPGVWLVLSGTEPSVVYQLFKDNSQIPSATLTGTGSAATFSGVYAAGTYRVQTAPGVFCLAAMAGAPTIIRYALPSAPTKPSHNARCGAGTVAFGATPPQNCTIDWYTASAGGAVVSGGTGVLSFSPSLKATTTYYAQARHIITGCVSATRLAVTATVNAIPVISYLSGNTNQVLRPKEAIKPPVKYTTNNANMFDISGLPKDITGSWRDNTYTISGIINERTAIGTYTYMVTPRNTTTGCVGSSTSGQITVNDAPPAAATARTWIFGKSKLVWGDRIVALPPNCTQTDVIETNNMATEYKVYNGRHYYTWQCAANSQTVFCPSPWRMPTKEDFEDLKANVNFSVLHSDWGYGGFAIAGVISNVNVSAYYWSSSVSGDYVQCLSYDSHNQINLQSTNRKYYGNQVRCVKNQ
jgi:uncharacterized protein (TIGR02145 family)